jgi:hypothetical protein
MYKVLLVNLEPTLQIFALFTEAEYEGKISHYGKVYWTSSFIEIPQGPYHDTFLAAEAYKKYLYRLRQNPTSLTVHHTPKVLSNPNPPKPTNVLSLDAFRASRPRRHW